MMKMQQIELTTEAVQDVAVPAGARIVHADRLEGRQCRDEQPRARGTLHRHDVIGLWALVDPDRRAEVRRFHVVPQAYAVLPHDELVYLGTVQLGRGRDVVHVIESPQPDASPAAAPAAEGDAAAAPR